jgi:nucleotide-binding universal stress UspA family protein
MKILVGFDGSPSAAEAVLDLKMAGLPPKTRIRLLFAIPPLLPLEAIAPDADSHGWYASAYAQARKDLLKHEREALRLMEKSGKVLKKEFPGWEIESETVYDTPAKAILKKEGAWKPDLIVAGSRGLGGFGRLFLGSVADKVLTHSGGNVRISRQRRKKPAHSPKLVVAYDGSPHSEAAIAQVIARTWPQGTRVKLVSVADFHVRVDEILRRSGKKKRVQSAQPSSHWPWIERKMEKAIERLTDAGFETSSIIRPGDARQVLLAEAGSFQADCIFTGSRGLSGMDRFMLGSVSAGVAAHAPCSVEIIRKASKGK